VLGAAAALVPGANAQAPFQAAQGGAAIDAADLAPTVLQGGVYARLPAGGNAKFLDIAVTAAEPSVVYLAASSRFVFAACLSGKVESGGAKAVPGEVIVWDFAGSKPQRHEFDVGRFLASSPLAADSAVRQSLEAARARQKTLVFWGLLQKAPVNLQAPELPQAEAAMREHLSPPLVAELRREAGADTASLPQRVAARFVAALGARDDGAVAALLHPELFRRDGQAPGDWLAVRAAYAKSLVQGPLAQELQGAAVAPGKDWAHWRVSAARAGFTLTLSALDGMPFVTALETGTGDVAAADALAIARIR
jgi:hypothetical protein